MANVTTTTQVDGPVDVRFQQRLLRRAKPLCPYFLGANPGDVMPSHSGTFTIKWRRFTNLTPTTTALTAVNGTFANPTRTPGSILAVTDTTAVLSKYGDFVVLNEEVDLKNYTGQAGEVVDLVAQQAGQSLNRLQRNTLEDSSTIVRPGLATSDTAGAGVVDPITVPLIQYVINQLDRENARKFTPGSEGSQNVGTSPILPGYCGICHSDVAVDIAKLPGFKSVETYAGQVQTKEGEFGLLMVAGTAVRFVMTSESSIDANSGGTPGGNIRVTASGTTADLYNTVIYGQDFHGAVSLDVSLIKEIYTAGDRIPGIQLISHGRGSGGIADPLNDVSTMGWKAWHTSAILNSAWGFCVRTAASKLV